MTPGPGRKALHEYFPTYRQFVERCQQAGYSLGKLIELHPELRREIYREWQANPLLKRLHRGYRVAAVCFRPRYLKA